MARYKWIKKLAPVWKFFKKDFKILLPQLYFFGLILSLVLTLLYTIYPSLTICSNLFGEEFCTPFGLFLGTTLSLPGYLVIGNLIPFLPQIPLGISVILVLVISGAIYLMLGMAIDKLKKVKRDRISSIFKEKNVNTFLIAFFILLVAVFLFLLAQSSSPGI